MKNALIAKITLFLSILCVVLAAVVSLFGIDLWLAGTQWILVAIVLAVWSVVFGE